jgi:predicted acetyltransferase
LVRPKHFWEGATADRDKKTVMIVHEDASGAPDGLARYDIKADWKEGLPAHKLTLHELIGMNDDVVFELWTYVLGVDLVREVDAYGRPVDEPLRWVLDEPRAVRTTTVRDQYWLRPLDVEQLLSSRTYATDVELTLEVHDPLLNVGGTFVLEGGPDGAICTRKQATPDLRLPISDLGSIALGGITPTELRRAGRIEEQRSGAVARADLAFLHTPRPWGDVYF